MFVVVRYIGLYWIVTSALVGSSFVPGPVEVGKVLFLSSSWAFVVFLSTADLLMILRVYAMWNQSRTIRFVLLSIYVIQTIISVVVDAIYDNPNTFFSEMVVRVLDFSFCINSFSNASKLFGLAARRSHPPSPHPASRAPVLGRRALCALAHPLPLSSIRSFSASSSRRPRIQSDVQRRPSPRVFPHVHFL
ncbi:hypothetical protein L210DRAFT_2345434 [Boletus edulis BED1]|uniref:Uncharacterized protein n=1 Tax=Boletus edulis BED1 TaxID=1328754 RepID=A0AAD4G748_BOLED|nr:hypothetical protein L210DRAFT_2345434 [Boletus edulis BED1]